MSGPRPAVSPTACCSVERRGSLQWIRDVVRLHSGSVRMREFACSRINARYLTREQLAEIVDLVVMDVSFISATLVLPAVLEAAFSENPSERIGRRIIVLVKPQFEVGREQVGKRGIVRDETLQMAAVEKVDGR